MIPGPSPFPAAPRPDPVCAARPADMRDYVLDVAQNPARPLIPAFVTTCPGVRGTTGSRSLQQHHRGCASPSAGASSVTGRSIPRANLKQVAGVPGGAVSTERSQMDYCSSCRRNLNGALVCPGCGAYAPDIAPTSARRHSDVASTATTRQAWRAEEVPAPASYPGTRHTDTAPIGSGASGDAMADVSGTGSSSGHEGTAPTGQGRAARRRQLARWKKNKRRAVAATAVAIVGGGLTVAALPTTRPSTSHTRGLTAGAGDRGHSQDSDHRLGGATGHPGFAASQHSSAHDGRPAAEHHRRHACHRDDERAAEVRRHGPGHRDSEGNAAHHNGAGQGDAGWQRGRPSLGPSPGNDRARCRRRPRRRHTGSEPSADNVGGRSDGTDARVSDRRVHRLRKEPSPRRQGRYGGSRSCRLLLPPLLLSVLRCDLGQLEVGVAEVVGAGPGCQEADHYAGKALESVSVDRPAPLRSGGT